MPTVVWGLRRLADALLTLLGVAIFVFLMLRALPGDEITAQYGTEAAALTDAQSEALARYYGLDQPLPLQFISWLGSLLSGNFGFSVRAQQSVLTLVGSGLAVTTELALIAVVLGTLGGVILGLVAASAEGKLRDVGSRMLAVLGLSVPAFLLGTTALVALSAAFGFNPNGRAYASLFTDPALNLQQMLLPALVLSVGVAAPIMRTTRSATLEVQADPFIRMLHAKGVRPRRILLSHVLRNAMLPVVTMTSIQLGYLLGGAVVVEQIFSLPGLGRQVVLGIQQQEHSLVQSTVVVIAVIFIVINLATDVLYRVIDPRVRAS